MFVLLLIATTLMILSSCRKSGNKTNSDFVTTVKSTNPVAYYRLEASNGSSEVGSSTYKFIGNGNNATGAPIGVEPNMSALLNGKDAWIATTQMGGIANAGSIMAWVNLRALPKDAEHILYVGGISQVGNDFDLQFEQDNALRFFTAAGSRLEYKPEPKSLVHEWHMIVATMDIPAHKRALYWDGEKVAADKDPGSPDKTSPLSIGESTVFHGRYFLGSIDEVALWDRALSASEVETIYKSTK